MEYTKATLKNTEEIYTLVQTSISGTYPKYYPKEVVDFFCQLHAKETIREEIENGTVRILIDHEQIIGTGSFRENDITRVYVPPKLQGRGYGSFIMDALEQEISLKYETVCLDASLPASRFYENRGYKTIQHTKRTVENGAVLVYEIMKKEISHFEEGICYNNRVFVLQRKAEHGEVDGNTIFHYHQKGDLLWADYSGGQILQGFLVGTVGIDGSLDFLYQHINEQKLIRMGKWET